MLVAMLHEHYSRDASRPLVTAALDCIRNVFEIKATRNDFFRLFCKIGLLPPLVRVLRDVVADKRSVHVLSGLTIAASQEIRARMSIAMNS